MALLAVQACGSDDGKKRSLAPGEAGAGGESTTPGAGGSAAGEPAISMAGEPMVSEAGAGGVVGAAGAGGEPSPPEPELLFTVKPGAVGLADTAVRTADNAQNVIYTSSTGSQEAIDGTNAAKITGEELGLAPTDQIVAFTLAQPPPQHPLYLLTVADGSEGALRTRIYDEYWGGQRDEESHLFYSDGQNTYRNFGEGGDEWGYNALLATQTSLGLSPGVESLPDDLTGLMAHDARLPITELYFTVPGAAEGVEGSAVADAVADERGCTVFKSTLDGTNTVAFTCTELGLVALDQIDGLAVLSDEGEAQVLFSVTNGSAGAADTAVATAQGERYGLGASLFSSVGDGSNALHVSARELGLGEFEFELGFDELDGFTVIDAPQPTAAYADRCELPDFYDAETGMDLASFYGTSHLGQSMLVFGEANGGGARILAFDPTTCTELQRKDMPTGFESPEALAVRPLAGWSALTPLDKVEYLRVTDDDVAIAKVLRRYDVDGVFQDAVPIADTYAGGNIAELIYEPVHDRLFIVEPTGSRQYVGVMPRPTAGTTLLELDSYQPTSPCATGTNITGTDALGNLYLAQLQQNSTSYKVCAITPFGEVLPVPYTWTGDSYGDRGFIVPGGAHYSLYLPDGPGAFIDRSTFTSP